MVKENEKTAHGNRSFRKLFMFKYYGTQQEPYNLMTLAA
jgi:hypothetical protein